MWEGYLKGGEALQNCKRNLWSLYKHIGNTGTLAKRRTGHERTFMRAYLLNTLDGFFFRKISRRKICPQNGSKNRI